MLMYFNSLSLNRRPDPFHPPNNKTRGNSPIPTTGHHHLVAWWWARRKCEAACRHLECQAVHRADHGCQHHTWDLLTTDRLVPHQTTKDRQASNTTGMDPGRVVSHYTWQFSWYVTGIWAPSCVLGCCGPLPPPTPWLCCFHSLMYCGWFTVIAADMVQYYYIIINYIIYCCRLHIFVL